MRYILVISLFVASCSAFSTEHKPEEKHHKDPIKIITKLGISYSDDLTLSGSHALDGLVMQQNTNDGAYFVAMAMRPLTEYWTIMGFADRA